MATGEISLYARFVFCCIQAAGHSQRILHLIAEALEKAWLKTTNIVLLGDFNCDCLCYTYADGTTESALSTKASWLQSV